MKLDIKKKLILVANAMLVCAIFVGNYFYLTVGGLTIKALCSAGFALIGIINLCYAYFSEAQNMRFCTAMSAGLFLACLGDIFLGFNFILGAMLFALGHICYFVAYSMLNKIKRLDIIISSILFVLAGTFILFCPYLSFPQPIMQIVCLIYALVICFMLGKATGSFVKNKTPTNAVLFVGSVLFFFSDLMLVFDWFMGLGRAAGLWCMATYYPAECLLGVSILISTFFNRNN